MKSMYLLILVTFILAGFGNAKSDENDDNSKIDDPEDRLLGDILDEDKYDRRVRPLIFSDNGTVVPLIVNVTFSLYTFIDMNEIMETGLAYVFIWEDWWDPRLAWDPKEYAGVDLITLHVDDVWIPDVFLYELTTGQNDDKGQKTHLRVNTVPEGDKFNAHVTLPYGALLIERCPMTMLYYPFDQQTCYFCMGAMASSNSQIIFRTEPRVHDRHHSTIGGEWILLDAVGVDVTYREFSISCIEAKVKRRSAFFGVNLFFPTIATCLLNTIGLFSQLEDSHTQVEIANLGQTTLLNLGVIMLTVAAHETPRGAIISLLGAFFAIMICQSLAASFTALYLRSRFQIYERRGLRATRLQEKARRKLSRALLKLGEIMPHRKSEICRVSSEVSVANAERGCDPWNGSDSDEADQENLNAQEGLKLEIIRWERICMWTHVIFIVMVIIALAIIGVKLSPPANEWHSDS